MYAYAGILTSKSSEPAPQPPPQWQRYATPILLGCTCYASATNIMTDTCISRLYRWLYERRTTGASRTISGRRTYHRTGLQAAWTCRKKEFHYEHEPRRQWCCLRETLYHAFLHLSSAFSKICKKNVSHSKAAHQNIPNTTHLPSSVWGTARTGKPFVRSGCTASPPYALNQNLILIIFLFTKKKIAVYVVNGCFTNATLRFPANQIPFLTPFGKLLWVWLMCYLLVS